MRVWPRLSAPRGVAVCAALLLVFLGGGRANSVPGQTSPAVPTTAPAGASAAPGVPFTANQLKALLPETVYFEGRTAPLQLRNAGGITLAGNQIVWVSLVDSSGYASSVQEKYQFYLVTEGPLRAGGGAIVPAGAYGGGFVGDHFLLMDLGGHTVAEGAVQTDAALARPRPLQVLANGPAAMRLFLGRRWISLRNDTKVGAR